MIHFTSSHETGAQRELPLQDADRARTQDDPPIVARLGRILVDAIDTCFGDVECSSCSVVVTDEQRNLLRGA